MTVLCSIQWVPRHGAEAEHHYRHWQWTALRSGRFTRGKGGLRCLLDKKLGRSHSQSGHCGVKKKYFAPSGTRIPTVLSIGHRYIDWFMYSVENLWTVWRNMSHLIGYTSTLPRWRMEKWRYRSTIFGLCIMWRWVISFTLLPSTTTAATATINYSRNRPWRPIGLWDVKNSTLSRQSAQTHQQRSTPQKH
jgi:hypothetical protein